MDIKTLTASDILSISLDRPERLFTIDKIKEQIRQLNKIWHPDVCKDPDSTIVFQRIQLLKKTAEERIANNTWNGPATLMCVPLVAGETRYYNIKYRRVVDIHIGKMYVGQKYVTYLIDPVNRDLYQNGLDMIKKIKYPAKKFEDQFKPQMPTIVKTDTTDMGLLVVFEKSEELVLLRDLLDYLPYNKMDPKHMAWIMSALSNLACFLEFNNIAHGALTAENIWVSPANHYAAILGGWWYARPNNEKLLALPTETLDILPAKIFDNKLSNTSYDRMLIKAVGLECVGDKSHTGSTLLRDTTIPSPVLQWLRSPSAKTAVDEYSKWEKARDSGFGPRKFIELVVDINKIY